VERRLHLHAVRSPLPKRQGLYGEYNRGTASRARRNESAWNVIVLDSGTFVAQSQQAPAENESTSFPHPADAFVEAITDRVVRRLDAHQTGPQLKRLKDAVV
jgi:hypothetical protein